MNVMLQHSVDMVEAERGLDYGSHQTSDRENGPVKVKEEKDSLSSAFIEWETEKEEHEEEEEVSHVCTSHYSGSDVCDAFFIPD
jgi:hypothetical protein